MTTTLPKQAMVLAAGFGKRMRPLTDNIPKPMVKVASVPLIDYIIDRLESAGITKLVVNTHYKPQVLEEHLAGRTTSSITVSREDPILDTGGGIAKAVSYFNNEPFFSINSDVIWFDGDVPTFERIAAAWNDDIDAVLLLHPVKTAIGYEGEGDFFADDSGNLRRRKAGEVAPYIYTGIQLLHPRMFAGCEIKPLSLNILYDKAMNATPPRIKGVIHNGALLNVGDVAGKEAAEKYMLNK